ncbi:MAG: ABC transporter permease [Deltaproteobacteria bacterium]|nr:ABC transporter permease [Deltaproteobacteria bacterium]
MKIKLLKPGYLPGLLTIVVCILLWKGVSLLFLPIFLPGPLVLLDRVILVYGDAASYIVVWQTLSRIFEGLIISMLIGTAIGLSMGLQRNVEAFLDSWIMVLLTFPAICWAFLSVLWFGLSDIGPVLTIVLIVFPFVAMNVWEGTKAIEKDLINMARVYKAKRYLTLRKVLIPQLMPYLFSSMRIALSLSWKIALVGEAFAVGSGVGQKLIYYFEDTRVDMMLAWGISFMIVMVLIDLFVFRIWERKTFAWRHQLAA